ncbi:MAG: SdpI family protein [Bdellovibrionales bacterium]|nr:SdpI family protein [Bdellovibrionales bacterium]
MKFLKENWMSLVLLLAMVAVSLYRFSDLPEAMPSKMSFDGKPIQYMHRDLVAFLMPILFLFLMVLLRFLVQASPQAFSMPRTENTMTKILFGCGLLLFAMHLGLIVNPGNKESFIQFFSYGIAVFLIVVGNVFGKTERNFFIGVRVPWTLASEGNWRATHRFGGKLMVISGILLLLVSPFYQSLPLAVTAMLVPALIPAFYSYYHFKKGLG